jgi:hypothetical protein
MKNIDIPGTCADRLPDLAGLKGLANSSAPSSRAYV